jgi:hypothetical protein
MYFLNGGLLSTYVFKWQTFVYLHKWRAVIDLCIYLHRRLLFTYVFFKWRTFIHIFI